MKRITVLRVGNRTFVREGFRKLLELQPDIEVVGEADDGRKAIALAQSLCPALVLMDIAGL